MSTDSENLPRIDPDEEAARINQKLRAMVGAGFGGKFTKQNGTETFKAFAFLALGGVAIYVLKLPHDVVSLALNEIAEVLGMPMAGAFAVGIIERYRKDR
jgi:hypothetical protein